MVWRRFDHISMYSNSILGISLVNYYKYRSILYLFRLIKYGQPRYLYNEIQFAMSARTRNLIIPVHTSRTLSLFTYGVTLWNCLPTAAKFASSESAFRDACGYFN